MKFPISKTVEEIAMDYCILLNDKDASKYDLYKYREEICRRIGHENANVLIKDTLNILKLVI